jgi:hypothetical protein
MSVILAYELRLTVLIEKALGRWRMRNKRNPLSVALSLLALLILMPIGVLGQDTDDKIKRLEELEARIDAKLKRLEELEARLEARLEMRPQTVAVQTPGGAAVGADGIPGMPPGAAPLSVAGAAAARPSDGKDLEARVKRLEEESIHQVSFRAGFTNLNRAGQSAVFTGGKNDTRGWNAGTVIGVKLINDPFFNNPLFGEVSLDYSRIEGNTKFALGKSGNQSLFRVSVGPKYRFDNLGELSPSLWRIRPWIYPIGLSFIVNSPPSDSAAYLSVGGTTGWGIEYLLQRHLSVGLGVNYNFYDKTSNRINTSHLSVQPYFALNF